MLTSTEIGQFQTFGYIPLRGAIPEPELTHLETVFERVMADAPVYNRSPTPLGRVRATPDDTTGRCPWGTG